MIRNVLIIANSSKSESDREAGLIVDYLEGKGIAAKIVSTGSSSDSIPAAPKPIPERTREEA